MIWYRVTTFLAERKKAIAAALAPLIVGAVAKYGFNIDVPVVEALVMSLISGVATHQTTNLSR